MLKVRIIPVLLHRDFGLVKGMGFDSRRAVGSPMQAVKVYNMREVDELVFVDVTATQQARRPDFELVDDLADECFMPLTVGGGVRLLEDVQGLLQVGADKVSLGSALVEVPGLLGLAARRFGSQSLVASIDYRVDAEGTARVWIRSATEPTELDPLELARRVETEGAGEILLTSIDRDGTMIGYDLDVTAAVTSAVSIPVIVAGGAGSYDDLILGVTVGGASAVAAASIFHFTQQTPQEARARMRAAGLPVRQSHNSPGPARDGAP